MQYKIDGSLQEIQDLSIHVFSEYPHEIKNKQLIVEASDQTIHFFSMIKNHLKKPVLVDFMTQEVIKFTIL